MSSEPERGLLEWQMADLFAQVAIRRHWFRVIYLPWVESRTVSAPKRGRKGRDK